MCLSPHFGLSTSGPPACHARVWQQLTFLSALARPSSHGSHVGSFMHVVAVVCPRRQVSAYGDWSIQLLASAVCYRDCQRPSSASAPFSTCWWSSLLPHAVAARVCPTIGGAVAMRRLVAHARATTAPGVCPGPGGCSSPCDTVDAWPCEHGTPALHWRGLFLRASKGATHPAVAA